MKSIMLLIRLAAMFGIVAIVINLTHSFWWAAAVVGLTAIYGLCWAANGFLDGMDEAEKNNANPRRVVK